MTDEQENSTEVFARPMILAPVHAVAIRHFICFPAETYSIRCTKVRTVHEEIPAVDFSDAVGCKCLSR